MRILKLMFRSLLIIAIVVVAGALISREVLLLVAASRFKSSLTTLRSTALRREYAQKCQDKGAKFVEGKSYATLQLRFLSSTEYVLEIICGQFSLDPIVLQRYALPPFVHKQPGNSGVLWGDQLSAVVLEVFGRKTTIGLENGDVREWRQTDSLGVGPVTVCAGYGFSCCQLESQIGVGQQLNGVSDCPKTCYTACETRPVLLSFKTQPFVSQDIGAMVVGPGQTAEFNYVIDKGAAESVVVSLDYGDGTVDQFTEPTHTAEHKYNCAVSRCEYTAHLTITDDRGVTAADLPLSRVRVVVQ